MADGISRNISDTLRSVNLKNPKLSTLSQKGDIEFVEHFLSENIQLGDEESETIQSQLYIASFWGFFDVVKSLVEQGADVNHQNRNTLWTPLHAATFQEHGKIIMYLLNKGSNTYAEDFKRRTPVDLASVSDKVWGLFAASNCEKTSKQALIDKQVLKKPMENNMPNQERKNISSVPINYENRSEPQKTNDRAAYAASIDGDVLAGDVTKSNQTNDQPTFNMWRN